MDLRAVNPKTDKMEAVLMSTPEGNDSGPSGDEDGSVSDHSCVGEPKKKVPPGTLKLAAPASATSRLPLSPLHARASKTSAAQKAEQKALQRTVCSALKKKGAAVSAEGTPSNTEHTSAKDHMEPRAAKRAREAVAAVQEGLKPERTRRAVAETREHPGAVASKAAKREREQSAAKAARQAARQEERAAAEAKADAKLAKQERRAAKIADRERKAGKAANKLAKQDENAAAVGTAEEQSAAKATHRPVGCQSNAPACKTARKFAVQRAPEEQEEKTSHLGGPAATCSCCDDIRSIDDYSLDEAAATDDDSGRSITSTSESASEGKERHSEEDSEEDGKEDDEKDSEED